MRVLTVTDRSDSLTLRRKSAPMAEGMERSDDYETLRRRMLATVRDPENTGVGIAAPQVGILRRVCLVLDEESEEYLELINPEIIAQSGEQTGLEGCLSLPGKWGIVTRPNRVRVRAQDRDGKWFEAEAEGLTARAFCHEIEHLDGHLFVEHIDHFLTEEELKDYLEGEE